MYYHHHAVSTYGRLYALSVIRKIYKVYYEEVTDMKEVVIKSIGLAATVVGLGATLVTDWVNDKKLDAKIAEKVAEALAKEKGL